MMVFCLFCRNRPICVYFSTDSFPAAHVHTVDVEKSSDSFVNDITMFVGGPVCGVGNPRRQS